MDCNLPNVDRLERKEEKKKEGKKEKRRKTGERQEKERQEKERKRKGEFPSVRGGQGLSKGRLGRGRGE